MENKNNSDDIFQQKKSIEHFSAIIRHGERADRVPGCAFKNKIDPQLTDTGIE